MSGDSSRSSRHIVQTLAAMLAHLLNTDRGGRVVIEPFAIYDKISSLLAKPNGAYVRLTGHKQMVDRTEEEAAHIYFDQVFDRRMFLARDGHTHKAHELLLALCNRGEHESWPRATLARSPFEVVAIGAQPPDLGVVAKAIKAQPSDISAGNPARSTRSTAGPLRLAMPGATLDVAEELSIWGAVNCAPRQLRRLAAGDDFNAFCSLVIKSVEAANAHYGALVSLGLSPTDWRDLSINTAKKMSAFLTEVRTLATEAGKETDTIAIWQDVWGRRPVPGYASAEDLWGSELGKAARGQARHWRQPDYDMETAEPDEDDREGQMLDRLSLGRMIEAAVGGGVINSLDGNVLTQLMNGVSLTGIAETAEVASLLTEKKIKIASYVSDIASRVQRHAVRLAKIAQDSKTEGPARHKSIPI